MAGIYVHIPFCSKRCVYCDFYSNTDMQLKDGFSDALIKEMHLRKDYLKGEKIDTIYFGGGTPSQLGATYYERFLEAIYSNFSADNVREITLEANPDDLSPQYISTLRKLPFNRISMGIQSFDNDDLRLLNRRHSAEQALKAVRDCQDMGFSDISIDLIYGLPGQTLPRWETNLQNALALDVNHISAYHLTYEEGTPLYRLWKSGKVESVDEDLSLALFETLIETLAEAGYEHYEISNFAKPNKYAMHNTAYWQRKKYVGLGPSAHSFDIDSRQWNTDSITRYIKGINEGYPIVEREQLSETDQFNEYIITSLRTIWGISEKNILGNFGKYMTKNLINKLEILEKQGYIIRSNDTFRLSKKGIFLSDSIIVELIE